MNSFNIQWLTQDKTLFELDWLGYLFSDVATTINATFDPTQIKTDKNTVLICNHAVPYRYALDRLREQGRKYIIVLLSDENIHEPCEWLHDPHCVGLLRNYVHPMQIQHRKVSVFGLGYKRGLAELCRTTNLERDLTWCFAGTPHGDRPTMLEVFKDYGKNTMHHCSGFGASDGLTTEDYVQMLKSSNFALCPPGQESNDSFRLYEALEAGCIPVTLCRSRQFDIRPSYWHAVFRGASELPFIVAEDWEEALEKVKNITDQNRAHETQLQCQEFWMRWKLNWKTMFADKISLIKLS